MPTSALTGILPQYTTASLEAGQPTNYSAAYGGIPQLPAYTTDTAQTIGTDVLAQLQQNLPGYDEMTRASSQNIMANLRGQISPDVLYQLSQGAAGRGIASGMPGSPASNAALLRALGLTSLGLQQQGEQQLTAAIGRTPIQQATTQTQTTDWAAQQAIFNAMAQPQAAANAALRAAQAGAALQGSPAGVGGGGGAGAAPATSLTPTGAAGGGTWPTFNLANYDYSAPFEYTSPAGSSLAWTGQDWGDLFGDTYDYMAPSDTGYNPATDQSYYTYGVPDWYSDWSEPSYSAPADTGYNPQTDQSYNTYGVGDWFDWGW